MQVWNWILQVCLRKWGINVPLLFLLLMQLVCFCHQVLPAFFSWCYNHLSRGGVWYWNILNNLLKTNATRVNTENIGKKFPKKFSLQIFFNWSNALVHSAVKNAVTHLNIDVLLPLSLRKRKRFFCTFLLIIWSVETKLLRQLKISSLMWHWRLSGPTVQLTCASCSLCLSVPLHLLVGLGQEGWIWRTQVAGDKGVWIWEKPIPPRSQIPSDCKFLVILFLLFLAPPGESLERTFLAGGTWGLPGAVVAFPAPLGKWGRAGVSSRSWLCSYTAQPRSQFCCSGAIR